MGLSQDTAGGYILCPSAAAGKLVLERGRQRTEMLELIENMHSSLQPFRLLFLFHFLPLPMRRVVVVIFPRGFVGDVVALVCSALKSLLSTGHRTVWK